MKGPDGRHKLLRLALDHRTQSPTSYRHLLSTDSLQESCRLSISDPRQSLVLQHRRLDLDSNLRSLKCPAREVQTFELPLLQVVS